MDDDASAVESEGEQPALVAKWRFQALAGGPMMAAGVIGSMLSALPDFGRRCCRWGCSQTAEVGGVGAADAVLAVNQALAASPTIV